MGGASGTIGVSHFPIYLVRGALESRSNLNREQVRPLLLNFNPDFCTVYASQSRGKR